MNVNHVTGDLEPDTTKTQGRRPDPTPEEIRERCLQIQSEWSEAERESRSCYKSRPISMDAQRYQVAGVVVE